MNLSLFDERLLFVFVYDLNRARKNVEIGVQTGQVKDTPQLRKAWQETHIQIQKCVQETTRFGVTNPLLSGGVASNNYWKWYQELLSWFNGLFDSQKKEYRQRVFNVDSKRSV